MSKKLRTYQLFKKKVEYELYLNLPRHQRVQLCRFRVSAHSLRIETGRYSLPWPTPVEERLCATCGVIEDETHFLISCKFHQCKERVVMLNFASSLNNSFQHLSQLDKCVFILSSNHIRLCQLHEETKLLQWYISYKLMCCQFTLIHSIMYDT